MNSGDLLGSKPRWDVVRVEPGLSMKWALHHADGTIIAEWLAELASGA
jgi:hypothetical protein